MKTQHYHRLWVMGLYYPIPKSLTFICIFFTFLFTYSQTLVPTDKLALLTGTVSNFSGKKLANEIILFENDQTKSVVKIHTDQKGCFEVLIPVNATYSLKYKNFTSDVYYTKMKVPSDADATYEVLINIEPPKEYILENVYFETAKSTINPKSYKALNDLVEVLKLKQSMTIELQGHTDNVGQENTNLKLSQDRADAVKKYLVSKGIESGRILAKGYGSSRPIATNADDSGKAKNRRTSLKVLKE